MLRLLHPLSFSIPLISTVEERNFELGGGGCEDFVGAEGAVEDSSVQPYWEVRPVEDL